MKREYFSLFQEVTMCIKQNILITQVKTITSVMISMEALLLNTEQSVLIIAISYDSTQCILNSHWSLYQITTHKGYIKEYAKCGTWPSKAW